MAKTGPKTLKPTNGTSLLLNAPSPLSLSADEAHR
jgi:hypothetical protein